MQPPKAMFVPQIMLQKNYNLKAPNLLYSLLILMSFLCHLYVIRMSNVCTRMLLICHTDVTRMYSYVICMLLVCARILSVCTSKSSVCHSYVLICHLYVTRMHSYLIRMSLVCTRISSVCDAWQGII